MTETQQAETIIVIGQGCWGRADSERQAKRNWELNGGQPSLGYTVVTLDAETSFEGVDGMGQIHYVGNEPTSRDVAARASR